MLDAEVQRQRVERALVRCPPATEGQDGQLGVLLLPDSEQEKDDDGAARLRQVRDYKLVAKPVREHAWWQGAVDRAHCFLVVMVWCGEQAKADEPTFVFMWDESGDVAQVFYSPVIARVELKKQHMQAARRDVRLQYRESTKAEDIQRQLKRVDIGTRRACRCVRCASFSDSTVACYQTTRSLRWQRRTSRRNCKSSRPRRRKALAWKRISECACRDTTFANSERDCTVMG